MHIHHNSALAFPILIYLSTPCRPPQQATCTSSATYIPSQLSNICLLSLFPATLSLALTSKCLLFPIPSSLKELSSLNFLLCHSVFLLYQLWICSPECLFSLVNSSFCLSLLLLIKSLWLSAHFHAVSERCWKHLKVLVHSRGIKWSQNDRCYSYSSL